MQILAATDFSPRSTKALRQAGLLARASDANLALVYVVDDDQPAALVEMEKREAERILTEQVGAMAELRGMEGRPFEVITQTTREVRPDLLVVGTHGRSGILNALIGRVTQEALRSLNVDILAVPPSACADCPIALAARAGIMDRLCKDPFILW